MTLFFALIVAGLLLLAMLFAIYSIGTGRDLFDDIERAAFIYRMQRRQYMRGRRAAIKETFKEMFE